MATLMERQPLPDVRVSGWRLPILDRYLLREMLAPFAFGFGTILLFWLLNIFFLAIDYLINQHAPVVLILRFLVFRIPQSIPMAFPFGCLCAVLFALGRMTGDNEITAMRVAGISSWRIALTPFVFGVVMFAVAFTMNEFVEPASVDLSTRSFYQIINHTDSLPVEPQLFRRDARNGHVYYVTQVTADNLTMLGVQIFEPGTIGWRRSLQAKSASIEPAALLLHDVIETRYKPDGFLLTQKHVPDVRVTLPMGESSKQFMSNENTDPWTMSSRALSAQISALQNQGVGGAALGNLEVNLGNRFSNPFMCIVSVLLAVPLAIRFGRRGRMASIALGFFSLLLYYVLMTFANAIGRNGAVNPYLASWLPNMILGTAGTLLLWLEER